jgi:hypothetical protein
MPQQQRMTNEFEIAIRDGHAQRGAALGARLLCALGGRRIEIAVGCRRPAGRGGARGTAAHLRRAGSGRRTCGACRGDILQQCERLRRSGLQELEVRGIRTFFLRELAVVAIELPRPYTGQSCARPRHAPVAARLRIEIDEPVLCADLVAIRRELRLAHDQHHPVGKAGKRRAELAIELSAQADRAVERILRRNPPLVRVELQRDVVPDAALARRLEIVGRELPPRGRAREVARRVEQACLHLDEAGERRHQHACLVTRERRADGHQQVAEAVVARQHLHRRPRPAVGRPEHEHARAVARHHPLPRLRPLEQHRAREQSAHRVRDDAHGKSALLPRGDRLLDCIREALRLFFQRPSPVVAEFDDLVRFREELREPVVKSERPVRAHAVLVG